MAIDRICSLTKQRPPLNVRGLLSGDGTVVPADDTDGWQTGAIFQHTDGGANTAFYVNEGTVTACSFRPVEVGTDVAGESEAIEFADDQTGPLISIDTTDPTGASYTTPFLITGTYSSTCALGIQLSATNQRPVSFLFDDGAAVLGSGNYRGVLSRVMLCATQTGQVAIRAIRGQVKVADAIDVTIATNEMNAFNGVEGYIELSGATAKTIGANTRVAAVHALLEVNQDITLTAGGKMVGVFSELSQVTAKTVGGIGTAAFAADRLDSDHATAQALWTVGYVTGDGSCTTGIMLGTCTTGISIGACTTAAINITGDQAIGILCDVDADWANGLEMNIDSSMTLTTGIEMSGAGTVTTGITISATACITGIAISSGSLTDGIKISGATPVDGVEVSSVCSAAAFHASTTSASGLLVSGACTTAAINITAANLNCIKSVFNVGAQLGQYVQGIKMEHTRSANIQPSTGGWWGAQIVLNAGTGYAALDKTAYVLHCVFKGDATAASSAVVNVARFETQSNGRVGDLLFVSANAGSTVEGDVARFVAHAAPTRAILAVQNGTVGSTPMGICVDVDETMTTGIQFNTGAALTNLFQITSAANTAYFLIADAEAGCLPNYSSGGSAIANLKVKIGSTDGYIKIYDAA